VREAYGTRYAFFLQQGRFFRRIHLMTYLQVCIKDITDVEVGGIGK